MPTRTRAGVPGMENARDKDMPTAAGSVPKRSKNADRRVKKERVRSLERFLRSHGAKPAEVKLWVAQHRAFLRGLPSRSASVADLCASRVINAYLSEFYSLEAKRVGPETAAGAKLAAQAHSAGMMAQRFALHARDLSYRESGFALDGDNRGAPGTAGPVTLADIDQALDAAAANVQSIPGAQDDLIARLQRLADWPPLDRATPAEPPAPSDPAPDAPPPAEAEAPPADDEPRVRVAAPPRPWIDQFGDGDPEEDRNRLLNWRAHPGVQRRIAEERERGKRGWDEHLARTGSPAAKEKTNGR